ncbi:MAG: hypothetical protein D6702_02470 [Planctomycetota bacterium]|nr:MAG: hypothetical protein D6702_02470 [Planctomycetota bacterium]
MLAALGGGCAIGDRGRLRQVLGQTRAEESTTTEATTLIDLAGSRRLSDGWELRASDRSIRRATTSRALGQETRSVTLSHQPSVDLNRNGSLFDINLSADRRSSSLSGGGFDNTLIRDNVFGRLVYHPTNLPQISLQSEQTRSKDDRGLDSIETRSIYRLEHNVEGFSYYGEILRQGLEDHQLRQTQDRRDLLAGLNADWASEDNTVTASIGLLHSQYDITERGNRGGLDRIPLAAGLYAIDDTPTLGTLPVNAQLVDGNLAAGAGVPIGGVASGGGIDRNIGFDQGPVPVAVDEIRLYTDVALSAAEARQFQWSVYSSNDNLSWKLERFSAPFRYDAGRQRFEIDVAGLASRYLKVVNTAHAPAAPAVEVSEIQAYGRQGGLGNGSKERQDRADLSFALRPSDSWSMILDGSVGRTERRDQGRLTRDENALRVNLNTTWRPLYWLAASAQAGHEDYDDPVFVSRLLDTRTGSLSFLPNERLSFDVSLSRREEDRDQRPYARNDALTGRASANFAHDILASLQATRAHQQEFLADRRSDRDSLLASVHAPVREDLEVLLEEQIDLLQIREVGVGVTDTDSQMTGAEFVYRPSELLTVVADLEYWSQALTNTGLTQRYRLDWLPFAGGQLLVQLDVRHETGGVLLGPTETTFAQVRWTLRKTTYLDLTTIWTSRAGSAGTTERVRSVSLTLSADF